MRASLPSILPPARPSRGAKRIGLAGLWLLWQGVRLPLYTLLTLLEPIVRFVLCAAALLGLLAAFVGEFASPSTNFPFWGMAAISLGCIFVLMLYYGLLRLLSQ